jgi:hypothetical protein
VFAEVEERGDVRVGQLREQADLAQEALRRQAREKFGVENLERDRAPGAISRSIS